MSIIFYYNDEQSPAISQTENGILSNEMQLTKKLKDLYARYELTQREIETFERLVTTEMVVQEIADEMSILN